MLVTLGSFVAQQQSCKQAECNLQRRKSSHLLRALTSLWMHANLHHNDDLTSKNIGHTVLPFNSKSLCYNHNHSSRAGMVRPSKKKEAISLFVSSPHHLFGQQTIAHDSVRKESNMHFMQKQKLVINFTSDSIF